MSHTLENALAELINTTLAGKDFVMSEAPEIVQQILVWHALKSGGTFIILLALEILILWLPSVVVKKEKELGMGDVWWEYTPIIGAYALVIFFSTIALFNQMTWLKIILTPELYLLEYAAGLAQ